MNIPFEYVVWTANDCADYLQESKEHFLRNTRHQRGFPRSIAGESKRPRWRAKDVTDWFLGGASRPADLRQEIKLS